MTVALETIPAPVQPLPRRELDRTSRRAIFSGSIRQCEFSMSQSPDPAGVKGDIVVATLRCPPVLGEKFAHEIVEYFGSRIFPLGVKLDAYDQSVWAELTFTFMENQEDLITWLFINCRKRKFVARLRWKQDALNLMTASIVNEIQRQKLGFDEPEAEQLSILES